MLFGNRERLEFEMPQCLLRIARFRGVDRMQFLDNRQFNGHAFALLASAERFLRDSIPIAGRFESDRFERIDEPLYPPLATRRSAGERLVPPRLLDWRGSVGVAIYDDRLEVTSSGSLHFGLTPEKLFVPHESRPWNPMIARTFYRRGIIEEWGSGTLKMADVAREAGLPTLEIEDANDCVTVCFRHGQFVARQPGVAGPTQRQEAILDLLARADDGLALREIRAQLGPRANERQLRNDLAILKARGLITSKGFGRGARWNRL